MAIVQAVVMIIFQISVGEDDGNNGDGDHLMKMMATNPLSPTFLPSSLRTKPLLKRGFGGEVVLGNARATSPPTSSYSILSNLPTRVGVHPASSFRRHDSITSALPPCQRLGRLMHRGILRGYIPAMRCRMSRHWLRSVLALMGTFRAE